MKFPIKSFIGAGPINFGMTPDQVRILLGGYYDTFNKVQFEYSLTDQFDSLGAMVSYKLPGVVEAIEFYSPASPEFENIDLLALSYDELKKFLESKDPNLEVKVDALTSYSLGIGAWTPHNDEDPSFPVECVIVFEKNYYDD